MLPDCGLFVSAGELDVLAAWLYQDNTTGVAWLAWFVANPAASPRHVHAALPLLLDGAEVVCKSLSRFFIHAAVAQPSLRRALNRAGWLYAHDAAEFWKPVPLSPQQIEQGGLS
jgi:hypothetical protein